jgi:hypothetical protein
MSNELRTLLSNLSTEAVDSSYAYGEKQPGAGYNRLGNPLHTVVYDVTDFVGSIKIQGTLEVYPGESDWVDIDGTEVGLGSDSSMWLTTNSINFTGNFVWLRAAYNLQDGTINSIRYNY